MGDDDLDEVLFEALASWWEDNRPGLIARGIAAELHGPFEAPGMDPVYILHLESSRREDEACLFRGGTLLLAGIDKHTAEEDTGHADLTSAADLGAVLARFAARA